jgi:hypothetical protein
LATSKSSVVGIRLDHDRRAWVEGEAARLGVSMRGLFEGMIDEARSGGKAEADRAIAGLGSATAGAAEAQSTEDITAAARAKEAAADGWPDRVNTRPAWPSGSPSGSSPWPDLGSITALPGGLIRGAFSLTTGLIESSARCATKRLGSCALTRHWSERSL